MKRSLHVSDGRKWSANTFHESQDYSWNYLLRRGLGAFLDRNAAVDMNNIAGQTVAHSEGFHFSVAGIQAATDKQFRLENKSHRTGQSSVPPSM